MPWATPGVTVLSVSSSTQTFSNQSPDVNVEVTNMVNMWLQGQEENYGMLVRFSGSQETDVSSSGDLKFFSSNTHTIYPPKLEVRWDDSIESTGSATFTELDVTGASDNFLYMIGLRDKYRETEKVKFRVGSRKQFVQKTFSTSVQTLSSSFIPGCVSGSGSYSILDVSTSFKALS